MNTASEIINAGGAYVRRPFTCGDRQLRNGDRLSAEQLRAMPIANMRALISAGKIELYPAAPDTALSVQGLHGKIENHLVNVGGGKYIVVRGVALIDKPVSREQAEKIAKTPPVTN